MKSADLENRESAPVWRDLEGGATHRGRGGVRETERSQGGPSQFHGSVVVFPLQQSVCLPPATRWVQQARLGA